MYYEPLCITNKGRKIEQTHLWSNQSKTKKYITECGCWNNWLFTTHDLKLCAHFNIMTTILTCFAKPLQQCTECSTWTHTPLKATARRTFKNPHFNLSSVQNDVDIELFVRKVNKYQLCSNIRIPVFFLMCFLVFTSFLASVLSQLWILRGHFLCCLSLMRLQGTPYCKSGTKTLVRVWQVRECFGDISFLKYAEKRFLCAPREQSIKGKSLWRLEVRTFSPPTWTSQKEWSSSAAWSPWSMQWLRPQPRLWWWSEYYPPPSLQGRKITVTSQSLSVCLQQEWKCHKIAVCPRQTCYIL